MTPPGAQPGLRGPSGVAPPTRARLPGGEIDLEPLADEACRHYRDEHPDEQGRYGSGEAWCRHDTLYLLAWAADDLRLGRGQLVSNVRWLARVLDARRFPVAQLERHLQLVADVVEQADIPDSAELAHRLRCAGSDVLADPSPDHPPDSSPVRDAYLAALLRTDPRGARLVVEAAVEAGLALAELYLSVLQPALYEIGRLWQNGEVTVAQEHLATATTQTLIAWLAPVPPPTMSGGPRAIITATQNELHALGPRFLADFLERDGWRVIDLGAGTPTDDLVHFVAQVRPELVCLSTTLTTNLVHAEDAISALRGLDPPPLIAVGGHAYGSDDQLAATLGADIHAGDAAAFLEILRARFPRLSRS